MNFIHEILNTINLGNKEVKGFIFGNNSRKTTDFCEVTIDVYTKDNCIIFLTLNVYDERLFVDFNVSYEETGYIGDLNSRSIRLHSSEIVEKLSVVIDAISLLLDHIKKISYYKAYNWQREYNIESADCVLDSIYNITDDIFLYQYFKHELKKAISGF